jgi:hypothetical protein
LTRKGCGGAQVGTDPLYLEVFTHLLKPFGYTVDLEFYRANIHGRVDLAIFRSLMPKVLPRPWLSGLGACTQSATPHGDVRQEAAHFARLVSSCVRLSSPVSPLHPA